MAVGVATHATFSLIVNDKVIRQEIALNGSHADQLQIFQMSKLRLSLTFFVCARNDANSSDIF